MFSETDLVNDYGQSIPFTALILSRVFDRPFELPGSASVVFPQLRDDVGGGVAHNSGATAAAGKDVGSGGGASGGEAGASNETMSGGGGGGDGKGGGGVSGVKAGQVSLGFWLELLTRQIGDATGVVALEVMSALVEASLGVQGVYVPLSRRTRLCCQ
jgi:hypothetical protein